MECFTTLATIVSSSLIGWVLGIPRETVPAVVRSITEMAIFFLGSVFFWEAAAAKVYGIVSRGVDSRH